jgi:hypothetical protein
MKAVVVGSMNCMPTEYAILLRKYCSEVVHYYDADENDTLSNPVIRWGGNSSIKTQGLSIRKIMLHHHLSYLLPRILHPFLLAQIRSADLLLLSGPNISLARLVDKTEKKVVALSYGNDISLYCNPDWPQMSVAEIAGVKRAISPMLRWLKSAFVKLQIAGLNSCTHYSYFIQGMDIETDGLLDHILVVKDKPIRLPRYSINIDDLEREEYKDQLAHLVDTYRIVFPVRFSECNELLGNKGWRLLFDGIKDYKKVAGKRFKCICFRKGDFRTAIDYAKRLGIEDVIEWYDTVSFDTIVQYYRSADVIVEQLGSHWIGQGLYAMVLGKPVIGRCATERQGEFFKASGLLFTEDVDSLVSHLKRCEDKTYRENIGERSRDFVLKNASIEIEFMQWNLV